MTSPIQQAAIEPRHIHKGGTLALWIFQIRAFMRRVIRSAFEPGAVARSTKCVDWEAPTDSCLPFIHETRRYRSLHFSITDVQSRMLKDQPHTLMPNYTRTMMGFLLTNSRPRRIAIIGLGGGSLAKFCYRELPESRIDVVEINPHVVALREEFHVPFDDNRFQVHLDDGARFLLRSPGQFDVLLVDAYTRRGIPPWLASQEFYNNCRQSLCDNGILVSNLYCEDSGDHLERIRKSFDGPVYTVQELDQSNEVVFACTNDQVRRQSNQPLSIAHFPTSTWHLLRPTLMRVAAAANTQRDSCAAERKQNGFHSFKRVHDDLRHWHPN